VAEKLIQNVIGCSKSHGLKYSCNKKLDESDNGVSAMRQFIWQEIQGK